MFTQEPYTAERVSRQFEEAVAAAAQGHKGAAQRAAYLLMETDRLTPSETPHVRPHPAFRPRRPFDYAALMAYGKSLFPMPDDDANSEETPFKEDVL